MLNRREFLVYSGTAAGAATTITLFPGTAQAKEVNAQLASYPRKLIAKLSELKDNEPVDFSYPDEGKNAGCMIVKTGIKCGGGLGKEQDVVAYSYLCTHQGGPLNGSYKANGDQRTLGQCPLHLSTYDARRHGIIVSGQAYQSLPQVMLELDGDNIYAVGIMGLLFGRVNNLMS
jgi:arsenite oxidase small subunit